VRQAKLGRFLPVKVRSGQSLTSSPVSNPAYGEVTSCTKPGGERCSAAAKAKVLSPEITMAEGRPDQLRGRQQRAERYGEFSVSGRGLSPWQGIKWKRPGTWEIQYVPLRG